jgi:hypothetical protein
LKEQTEFSIANDGIIMFRDRVCVPDNKEIRKVVMEEGHGSRYSIHPGATKMYQDLKRVFWWPGMNKEIADFVSKCLTCQKVKVEHQKPSWTTSTFGNSRVEVRICGDGFYCGVA